MAGPSIEIRSATVEEMPQAISSIVAAFITDPIARFACPSLHEHLRVMPLAAREFAGKSFEHGTADVTEDFCGVGLWLPPDVHPNDKALDAVFRGNTPADRIEDLSATFEKMGEYHPEEPHWYLPLVGVEPNAQGTGLGGALMRHATVRCDRERVIAYLESSNPQNISLYERHGFEVMGKIQVGAAPLVTPMLRQPR